MNYTTKDLFDIICRYVEQCKETPLCNHLSVNIFNQTQFEAILNCANRAHLRSLNITLYCEAMINIRGLIYEFRKNNPFMTLMVKYVIEREETFTVRDLMKEMGIELKI